MSTGGAAIAMPTDDDLAVAKMGYKPELRRGLGLFSNASFGFNIVGVLSSFALVYGQGLTNGGPAVMTWGFLISFFMTIIVCVCLTEIAYVYPAVGGVYNWTAQVTTAKRAPVAAYICGWSNLFGYIVFSALGFATFGSFVNAALIVSTGQSLNEPQQAGIAIAALVVAALTNITRIDELSIVSQVFLFVQVSTMLIMIIALFVVPHQHNTDSFVFFSYNNETGNDAKSYVVAIGLVIPAFIFTGFDGCAHLAEETINSRLNAPRAMLSTVIYTGLLGFTLLVALLYATTDIDAVLEGETDFAFINVFVATLSPQWASAFAWLVVINILFGNTIGMGITGRIAYALARDSALPFSHVLSKVDQSFKSPIYSILFASGISGLLLLFLLDPSTEIAFASLVGLGVIGIQVSYAMPILCRLIYRLNLPVSGFTLGVFSAPLGVLATFWLLGTATLGFLPTQFPVNAENMNWSVVAAAAYALLGAINWFVNSRHEFNGPVKYDDDISPTSSRPLPPPEPTVNLTPKGSQPIECPSPTHTRSLKKKWLKSQGSNTPADVEKGVKHIDV